MSKKSEIVKKWRKNTKSRIIKAFGGSCCICGYNKCNEALGLHHLDPTEKDFSLGGIKASPGSWDKIVNELRKCILVCSRCHIEIHYDITLIPKSAPRFNEEYADYKKMERMKKMDYCPVCGEKKWSINQTCSKRCAGSLHGKKIDWNNVDLVEMKRTMSFVDIAEILGISDTAVRKRWKKIYG